MVVSVRPFQRVILGGVLLHLTIGTLYCFGNIQPYVTSYLRLYDPTITTEDTSIIYSCAALANSLTMPLAGLLQFALGIRGSAALGTGLVVLATLGSSTATTVTGLAALNAVFGCGISFVYTCPIVSGYAWMPHRKGTVSGFVVGGFGAGAAVFNAVSIAWLNPSNVSPNPATGYYTKDIAERVPGMYLLLAACFCVMGFSGASMLAPPPAGRDRVNLTDSFDRERATKSVSGDVTASSRGYSSVGTGTDSDANPEEEQHARSATQPGVGSKNVDANDCRARDEESPGERLLVKAETSGEGTRTGTNSWVTIDGQERSAGTATRPYHEKQPGGRANGDSSGEPLEVKPEHLRRQYALKEVVLKLDFYHLALSLFLTAVSGFFIAGNYKAIANHHFPNADRFLSIMGSLASLFNSGGRIVAGLAIDRFGSPVTLMAMSTGMTSLLLFMYATAGSATKGLFLTSICALFMLYGSNFAIYPTLTAELFGVSSAGGNYGLAFMINGTASSVIMMYLADIAGSDRVYLACAALSLMGTISVTLLWFKGRQVGTPLGER